MNDNVMGYQETLIYLQPQSLLPGIYKAWSEAAQKPPDKLLPPCEIVAVFQTKRRVMGWPAGVTLLCVTGEREATKNLEAALQGCWKKPLFCRISTQPLDAVVDASPRDAFKRIAYDADCSTESAYLVHTNMKDFARNGFKPTLTCRTTKGMKR